MNRRLQLLAVLATGLVLGLLLHPAAVEAQRQDTIVRIVDNDVLVNRLIGAIQQLAAAQAVSSRARAPIALGFNKPVGQVGDALKVWPIAPADPCAGTAKGDVAISQTSTARLVPGIAGQRIFVCAARLVAGVAEIASFTEGTGTTCGTGESAVSGSTTAANGESYAANGGFAMGNGAGSVMVTNKAGDDLCLKQSGSNRLSGNIVYAYGQ